jgi:hypothetical protein
MRRPLKGWAERAVGAALPAWFWGKLFRLAVRQVHRRGPQFLTFHARPKRAADVGLWSDRRPGLPTVAVVLQGPLLRADDFTLETVRLYRRTFAGCPLIVSTWEGEDAATVALLRDAGAEVLLNGTPAFAGFKNTNLQLASALAGVERAKGCGADFVLKTRTDVRMYAPNIPAFLLGVWEAFPPAPGYRQRGRLVGTSLGSHKYVMYQFSDMNVFGHVEDVLAYYSAPPSATSGLPPDFRDVLAEAARINAPEHYLLTQFLERAGRPTVWTLDASWRALADHVVIVDRQAVDLVWFKYSEGAERPATRYHAVTAASELTFGEWLNLHLGLANKADLGHHRASQDRSFAADMPPAAARAGR